MQKKNFVSLVMGTIGGILFAIGMCMCLLPAWGVFTQGVVMGAVGAVILLAMLLVRRKMEGRSPVRVGKKTIGAIALGVVGALTLGVGMCMTMVWEGLLVWGIIVGVIGIVLLLCLIPLIKGIK